MNWVGLTAGQKWVRRKHGLQKSWLKHLSLAALGYLLLLLLNSGSIHAQGVNASRSSLLPASGISASGASLSQPAELMRDSAFILRARQMSIRILGAENAGSGVLIQRQGQHYIAITNAHVLEGSLDQRYTILTSDGRSYSATRLFSHGSSQDLALVQFQSDRSYPTAQLRNLRDLQMGEAVYAAGFPNWSSIGPAHLQSTEEQGARAFSLTVGRVEMLLSQSFRAGYQLGYTNEVEPGMSGGALLDRQGRLVGMNGVLKSPPQGITAFALANGTLPPEPLFQAMNSLSWAIPAFTIEAFLETQVSIRSASFSRIQY